MMATSTSTIHNCFCAWCYKELLSNRSSNNRRDGGLVMQLHAPLPGMISCGSCQKRIYCSEACKRDDWTRLHGAWCKRSGEINFDYELRDTTVADGCSANGSTCTGTTTTTTAKKGVGMFALRPISRGQVILVERPVVGRDNCNASEEPPAAFLIASGKGLRYSPAQKEAVEKAFMKLEPQGEGASFTHKHSLNKYHANGYNGGGVFLTASRINHSCLSNANMIKPTSATHGWSFIVAGRDIQANEEITTNYNETMLHAERVHRNKKYWSFVCSCKACTGPDCHNIQKQLDKMQTLERYIDEWDISWRLEEAMNRGDELISLYEQLELSHPAAMSRLYFSLFQVAICKKEHLDKAREYLNKSVKNHRLRAPPQLVRSESLKQKELWLQDPTQFEGFGFCD